MLMATHSYTLNTIPVEAEVLLIQTFSTLYSLAPVANEAPQLEQAGSIRKLMNQVVAFKQDRKELVKKNTQFLTPQLMILRPVLHSIQGPMQGSVPVPQG